MSIQNHLFVTFLMVNAFIPPASADATTQPDGHVATPPAQAPTVTPNRALAEMIEVWNNSDFKVYAVQQGKKTIVEPKGRMRLDNRYPVTISPVSPADAFKFASLVGNNPKCETQYCLIVQGTERP
ncbi:hypothetical protein SO486_21275 [Pseudomonas salmasensis]|uniref:Uncharacterized protein n=1 Tax=Pseudomonas salmasensis TaxID=2745514 RepID=A0ABU5FMM0_9PSED|nr:hypothetical protein [Pseudomonas salmasensis]MDY4302505.1 hypothetical protein [Pseudomonas salmasensis]